MREPLAHLVLTAVRAIAACLTEALSAFEGDVTEAGSTKVRSRRERHSKIGGGGFSTF